MSDRSGGDAVGKSLADLQAVGETARQFGGQAGAAGAQAVGQAQDVAHEARAKAASVADVVTEKVSATAQAHKDSLAGRLEDVAAAVHRSGEQLEGHQDELARLVERGADELAALAGALRTQDLRSLLGNLEDFSRRQPALFVGATLAAGFALTRLGRVAVAGGSASDLPQLPEVSLERK